MRILLAFNGSGPSEAALRAVIAQRRPQNSEVKVLRVVLLDGTEVKASQAQASLAPAAEALRVAGNSIGQGPLCFSSLRRTKNWLRLGQAPESDLFFS